MARLGDKRREDASVHQSRESLIIPVYPSCSLWALHETDGDFLCVRKPACAGSYPVRRGNLLLDRQSLARVRSESRKPSRVNDLCADYVL